MRHSLTWAMVPALTVGIASTALADDYPNNAGTFGSLAAGQSVFGTLEHGGDQDWFAIDLLAGTSITFDLEGQATNRGSLRDPLLVVYGVNGQQVGRNDDGGQQLNARLVLTAPYTGRFFVSAESYGSSSGTYVLTASAAGGSGPGAFDDYPANTGTPGRIQVPGTATGNLETGNDQDWFAIQAMGGQSITVGLEGRPTGAGSLGDPLVEIYDSFGTQIARNDDGGQGFNSLVTFTAPRPGTYYVAAGSFGSSTGTYTVRVSGGQPVALDDFGQSPTTQGRLGVPGSVFGTLEAGTDEDWFAVQLQPGVPVVFDLEGQPTGRGTLSDPFLRLYNQQGAELARNDDGGQGFNARLQFTPPSFGTYFVGAGSFGNATGTYALTASGGAPVVRDDYPGNTQTPGRLNTPGSVTGTLETGNDQDWFAVQLQGGTAYTIDLEGEPTRRGTLGDPLVRLVDSFGNQIGSNDDGGQGRNARLQVTAPGTGTYFVSAESWSDYSGTYTLSISGPPVARDDYAGNTGTSGQLGVPGSVTGTLETGDDEDWFRVQLQGGQAYVFDLQGQPTGRGTLSDPYLRIHDARGTELDRNDDGGEGLNSRLNFTAPGGGTYYLAVRSFGAAQGTYALSAVGAAPPPPTDDFAGNTGTAGRVQPGGSAAGTIETGNDQDWFAVQMQGGVRYTIDLEGQSTNAGTLSDPLMTVHDGFGTEVARNDDGGQGRNARLDYTAPSSGTFYIGAASFGQSTGSYRLRVGAPAITDDFAGDPGTVGFVAAPGSVTGTLETGGDHDWFRVDLQGGVAYNFDVEGVDTNRGTLSDPLLVLRTGSGAEVARDDDGGQGLNSRLEHTPTASGAFYLDVGSFGSSQGSYTLSVTAATAPVVIVPPVTGADDFGHTRETAGTLTVGGSSRGNLEVGGDVDWFRVTLQPGTTYTIDMEGRRTGGGTLGDPFLRVFNPNGAEVTSDDDGGQGLNARITFTTRLAGDYFINAESFGNGTGDYTVSIR